MTEEVVKYKNVLKRKVTVDYYQWKQNEKKKIEILCDHVLYNSIKECEIEIEKNAYIDEKESNNNIYGNFLSILILYITVACSLFVSMIGQYASMIFSLGDNIEEISTRVEFVKICEAELREQYNFWNDIMFIVIVLIIIIICVWTVGQRKKRENDFWKLLYYKDRMRLLKEEEKKRTAEKIGKVSKEKIKNKKKK